MKLIDRDELLRNIEADIDISVTGARNMEAVKCCLQNILDDVKESPVVDAVEVVRCKDCKHWLKARNDDEYSACSIWFDGWGDCMDDKSENDYCSRAERKEE